MKAKQLSFVYNVNSQEQGYYFPMTLNMEKCDYIIARDPNSK